MMSFEEFLYYIEEHILKGWKEDASATVQETRKNNGITYQGLTIQETEEVIAPCIYLEEFYEEYQKGEGIDKILERIRCEYQWAMERLAFFELDIFQFEYVKDKIIFRLINYMKNKDILEDCPHIRMYDLALTFRWVARTDSVGISTALITNRELALWKITLHELLLLAKENTQRLFPPLIINMDDFLAKSVNKDIGRATGKMMYIMTNEQQVNGAVVLVYDGVLQQFADELREDLYILPSSIHELILVPASEFPETDRLLDMVKEANRSIVSPVDILSDSVYYYNRRKDRLTPVSK